MRPSSFAANSTVSSRATDAMIFSKNFLASSRPNGDMKLTDGAAFDAIGEHFGELVDRGLRRRGIEHDDFGLTHRERIQATRPRNCPALRKRHR